MSDKKRAGLGVMTMSRTWWLVVAGLSLTLVVGIANAIEDTPTHTFSPGTPISSSSVNENFAQLYQAVAALEGRVSELETQAVPLGTIAFFAFSYTPVGWLPCDGRAMNIMDNIELYSVLGTSYGGNGTTEFQLPDLRGRVVIGSGAGDMLTNRQHGEQGGREHATLTVSQLPSHGHSLPISEALGETSDPPALMTQPTNSRDVNVSVLTGTTGNQDPVSTVPPYTALGCYIRVEGVPANRS